MLKSPIRSYIPYPGETNMPEKASFKEKMKYTVANFFPKGTVRAHPVG
jgi:hypothetical protein